MYVRLYYVTYETPMWWVSHAIEVQGSTLSLTSALDGGMWFRPRSGRCTPEKGTRDP